MSWTQKELKKLDPAVLEMSGSEFINYTSDRLKTLPRAQRRAKEREVKESMATMKSFSPKQMELMVQAVNHACGRAVQEELDRYNDIMDGCITAYLYMKNENITIENARKEQDIIAELITDDVLKYKKRLEESGGNEEMANKKLEKMVPEVREYSNALIDKGMNQGQAVKELMAKFPTLSRSMLTNAFKKVKEERRVEDEAKKLEVDTEVIEAAEYIFPEIKPEELTETHTEEEPQDIIEHSKADIQAVEPQTEVNILVDVKEEPQKEIENDNDLKIIYRQMTVEGKHNKYTVYKDHVKVGGKSFNNIDEVENYHKEQIELFNAEMQELKKVISMI